MKYSLEERSKGRYRVRVSMGRAPDGTYPVRSKSFSARTKREAREKAEDFAAIIRAEADAGTFRALAEAWYLAKLTSNKPSTMRGYRSKLDTHILPVVGSVQLLDLDRAKMAAWYDGLDCGPRTRNQLVAIVRGIARWGVQRGRISRDDWLAPLETTTSGLARTKAPERDDLAALLRHLAGPTGDPLLFVAVYLAASTGVRRGELLGLTVGDVNLEVGSLRVERSMDRVAGAVSPKTETSRRVIALPRQSVQVLSAWLESMRSLHANALGDPGYVLPGEQWLFPSPTRDGRTWNPEGLSRAVARHVVAAGLPPGAVVLHRLRNRSITALADAGVASRAIAERHGHAHVSVTEGTYMGRLPEQDLLMAEILGRSMDALMAPEGDV